MAAPPDTHLQNTAPVPKQRRSTVGAAEKAASLHLRVEMHLDFSHQAWLDRGGGET